MDSNNMYYANNFFSSFFSPLLFSDPNTTILGPREVFLSKGSTLNLTCVIRGGPEKQPFILWTHNSKVRMSRSVKTLLQLKKWRVDGRKGKQEREKMRAAALACTGHKQIWNPKVVVLCLRSIYMNVYDRASVGLLCTYTHVLFITTR